MGAHTAPQGTYYGFERQGGLDRVDSLVRFPLSTDWHAVHDIVVMIEWASVGKQSIPTGAPSEASKLWLLKSPQLVLECGTPGRNPGVGAYGR
jgi:hypothetical protein